MKTKLLILATLLLAVFAIALPSCGKDDPEPVTSQGLLGHWKLQGFWSGDTQIPMEIARLENPYNYTLEFEDRLVQSLEPGNPFVGMEIPASARFASGQVVMNAMWIAYTLHSTNGIKFIFGVSTLIGEPQGGDAYWDCMEKVSRYRVRDNTLDLYYSDTEYMRFKRIQL